MCSKMNLLNGTHDTKIVFQKTVTKSSNLPETGKQCRSNFFLCSDYSDVLSCKTHGQDQ